MKQKTKILLINPKGHDVYSNEWREISFLTNNSGLLLNAALPTLVALTPRDKFEISIVDEYIEEIDFNQECDIVGITGFPPQYSRGHEIAIEFKKRGKLIVCGGSSVSCSMDRWEKYADVLFIGEGEITWPQFLKDYEMGSYKNKYYQDKDFDIANSPIPDYSAYSEENLSKYYGGVVLVCRGCPNNCEFCDAIEYSGRRLRYKPVENIINELEALYQKGIKRVFLAADNLTGNRSKAREILKGIRDWNQKKESAAIFATNLDIDIANHEDILELAAEAGLNRAFVGLETPNPESLSEAEKNVNLKNDVHQCVKAFHIHGIQIMSGSIVGFDSDDLSIFQMQFDYFTELGIPGVSIYSMQARDMTRLKDRIVSDGRYIDDEIGGFGRPLQKDTPNPNSINVTTILYKKMSIAQLQQGGYWLLWKLYDFDNYIDRLELFIKDFQESPKLDKIKFLKFVPEKQEKYMVQQLHDYAINKAPEDEKKAILRGLDILERTSVPNKSMIVVRAILQVLNIRRQLKKQVDKIETIEYPKMNGDRIENRVPQNFEEYKKELFTI